MGVIAKFKHHFFNAFRELFIYHHTSLEFRASTFAVIIAANEQAGECEFNLVMEAGQKIYNDDDRARSLTLLTEEYVRKVWDDNGLDIDKLVHKIIADLRVIPRYSAKIDISQLEPILACNHNEDSRLYQERIIEFLTKVKNESGLA